MNRQGTGNIIVNPRGTSGSGKSTIVRNIRDLYRGPVTRFYADNRKQPLGYRHDRAADQKSERDESLIVIGHYETACGGCDTISKQDEIYRLIREGFAWNCDVIYEGLLLSTETRRAMELATEHPVHFLRIDYDIEKCIADVNARRQRRKPDAPPVKEKATRQKYRGTINAFKKFDEAGLDTFVGDRAAVEAEIRRLLAI